MIPSWVVVHTMRDASCVLAPAIILQYTALVLFAVSAFDTDLYYSKITKCHYGAWYKLCEGERVKIDDLSVALETRNWLIIATLVLSALSTGSTRLLATMDSGK